MAISAIASLLTTLQADCAYAKANNTQRDLDELYELLGRVVAVVGAVAKHLEPPPEAHVAANLTRGT